MESIHFRFRSACHARQGLPRPEEKNGGSGLPWEQTDHVVWFLCRFPAAAADERAFQARSKPGRYCAQARPRVLTLPRSLLVVAAAGVWKLPAPFYALGPSLIKVPRARARCQIGAATVSVRSAGWSLYGVKFARPGACVYRRTLRATPESPRARACARVLHLYYGVVGGHLW